MTNQFKCETNPKSEIHDPKSFKNHIPRILSRRDDRKNVFFFADDNIEDRDAFKTQAFFQNAPQIFGLFGA